MPRSKGPSVRAASRSERETDHAERPLHHEPVTAVPPPRHPFDPDDIDPPIRPLVGGDEWLAFPAMVGAVIISSGYIVSTLVRATADYTLRRPYHAIRRILLRQR